MVSQYHTKRSATHEKGLGDFLPTLKNDDVSAREAANPRNLAPIACSRVAVEPLHDRRAVCVA